jgi:hypothetical protein
MNRNDNITKTGSIGEKLVLDYLNETGEYNRVSLSENVYDMHKDISASINGLMKPLKVEVKTRTVIRKHYAMPLEKSQWYKADNADKLFFISNPTSRDETVKIYEATKDSFMTLAEFGPRKTPTRMYDLGKMKVVKEIDDPSIISRLYELSVSNYKQ